MKKGIIASIIALGFIGTAAQAAQNEVIFLGAVTATTCDLTTTVGGVAQPNGVVQLGTVAPSTDGQAVQFALKAANPADPACAALTNTQTATVNWASATLGATGFGPTSGAAVDSLVLVNSINSKTPGAINGNSSIVDFTADKVLTDGLQFDAKLKGGATVGDFKSVASFAVAYK